MDESKSEPNKNTTENQTKQIPPPVKGLKKTEDSGGAHYECHHKQGIPWPQRIEAACAVLLVFITGTYTYFACKQWSVMNDTLKLERPWVGPTKREFYYSHNRMVGMDWHFQNGGRTPATRVRSDIEFRIGPIPEKLTQENRPKIQRCEDGELSDALGSFVAIPNVDSSYPIAPGPQVIAALDDVYSNKVGLYLTGCVDYSDSSKINWYRTNVLETFHPTPQGGELAIAMFGNDAR